MAPIIDSPQDRQPWWRTLVSLPTYYHLLSAELELRAADTRSLSPGLRQARQRNLDRLRDYRVHGQYPRNLHSPTHAVPCFMDHAGRLCAVAHLMHASGETAAVREIARTANYARLAQMQYAGLADWAATSGLTLAELARIQPTYRPERETVTADLILNPVDNQVTLVRTGKTVSLTPIESRLLRCLVGKPGRTLTRETLMLKCWGYVYEGESSQLDVFIKRLRNKIEENPSEPKLLRTMRGVGYRFQPSDLPLHPVEAEGTLGVHQVDCAERRSAPVLVRPTFVYPVDGQTLDCDGSYLFKVEPIAGADGYLWGFFQGGTMVWENLRDEGTLSTTEYGIHPGSTGHSTLQSGPVEVWVRAGIRGSWTEATTITIHLRYVLSTVLSNRRVSDIQQGLDMPERRGE